jgi:hypothetical protein
MGGYLQNLLKLLNGQDLESVIWTADLEYWITGREVDGIADPSWRTEEGFLQLCRDCRVMPYYYYGSTSNSFWLGESVFDKTVSVESVKKGNTTTTTFTTPLGELIDKTEFVPESCSEAHTRFPVQNKKDLDILCYIMAHRTLKPCLLDEYNQRRKLWEQYDGLPAIALPRSPLAAFFYEWAGIMNGVYLLMDYPKLVEEIFTMMHEQEAPVIKKVCEVAPPLVHFADNMSSDNMAGYYHDFMETGHRRRIERLHSAGIKCAVHLDGMVRGLLPKLSAVGFDAIEALTPKPSGDMDIEEMRDIAQNDKVILWGGVPGILFSPPYTWNDMRKHVENVLEQWAGTRFVLGVADQIPPDGNIDFCKKIADMIGGDK